MEGNSYITKHRCKSQRIQRHLWYVMNSSGAAIVGMVVARAKA